jgi:hypothetical protein
MWVSSAPHFSAHRTVPWAENCGALLTHIFQPSEQSHGQNNELNILMQSASLVVNIHLFIFMFTYCTHTIEHSSFMPPLTQIIIQSSFSSIVEVQFSLVQWEILLTFHSIILLNAAPDLMFASIIYKVRCDRCESSSLARVGFA